MIECNYEFQRFEGNKKNKYTPAKIIKKIGNLCYIKAPNSFGKSTFLNLIGLGFYAHQNQEVHEVLRSNINDLLESENQKIKFDLRITNKNMQILISKKELESKDFDIFEISNGKKDRLTPLTITKKFKIIYDIPRNPTTRLKQLTEEVRDEQNKYGNRISRLRTRILEILEEIRESKDPDYINSLNETKKEFQTDLKSCDKNIEKLKKESENLEDYFFWRMFNQYSDEYRKIEHKKECLKSQSKSTERRIVKENKEFYNNYNLAKHEIKKIEEIYSSVTNKLKRFFPKQSNLLEVWERVNIAKSMDEFEFNENFYSLIIRFKNMLQDEKTKLKEDKSNQEALIYQQLIQVLERFPDLNLRISILNKSLKEFLDDLKSAFREKSLNIQKIENIDQTILDLEKIEKHKKALETELFPTLIKLKPYVSSSEKRLLKSADNDEKIKYLEEECAKIREQLRFYKAQYEYKKSPSEKEIKQKIGKEIRLLDSLNEAQINKKIKDVQDEVSNEKANKKDYERKLKNITLQIKELESKDEHPYKKYEKKINDILEIVRKLDNKINAEFTQYLEDIKNEKEPKNMSNQQKKYTDIIFEYLGKRLGKILIHTGEHIIVSRVDLFKGTLETAKGGTFYLKQMGTGQSQAAYLLGLLSTEDD